MIMNYYHYYQQLTLYIITNFIIITTTTATILTTNINIIIIITVSVCQWFLAILMNPTRHVSGLPIYLSLVSYPGKELGDTVYGHSRDVTQAS